MNHYASPNMTMRIAKSPGLLAQQPLPSTSIKSGCIRSYTAGSSRGCDIYHFSFLPNLWLVLSFSSEQI